MTVPDLARRVDADTDAVRGMLDVWCRKGRVARVPLACGGCTTACDVADTEIYRWLDPSCPPVAPAGPGASECSTSNVELRRGRQAGSDGPPESPWARRRRASSLPRRT
jgi:hypothetical protein